MENQENKVPLNITKGEAKILPSHKNGNFRIETSDSVIAQTINVAGSKKDSEEEKANAELIAQAFNVANRTGLTPEQMEEQIKILGKALIDISQEIPNPSLAVTKAIKEIIETALQSLQKKGGENGRG